MDNCLFLPQVTDFSIYSDHLKPLSTGNKEIIL